MPPPWPPAPLHTLQEEEEEESALAAMLMAWYMSGYHTGFYVVRWGGKWDAWGGGKERVCVPDPPTLLCLRASRKAGQRLPSTP